MFVGSKYLWSSRLSTCNFTKKTDSFTGSWKGFVDFWETHFEGIPMSGCFWCFQFAILIQVSLWLYCFVDINFLPTHILYFLQNTTQNHFEWHVVVENIKIVCVKFFGKIGCIFVADLAYFIMNHLKSICWNQLH